MESSDSGGSEVTSSVGRGLLTMSLAPGTSKRREEFKKGSTHPEILPTEIELGSKIGEGSFSKVYKGTCRGQSVAVKIFHVQNDPDELENIRKEIAVMSQIFHPNVVLFMGACTDPNKKLMIVTERLPTDLHSLLILKKNKYDLSLRKRLKMAKEAALGVNWLHSGKSQFIHRDLKLSNLLVTHDFHVRVADFGLTRIKDKKASGQEAPQGSPAYMAPEVFLGDYDEKCDVYSFGLCLWEMVMQEQVFTEYPNIQQLMFAVLEEKKRPPVPNNIPTSLRKLLVACWHQDPKQRPSFREILERLEHVLVDVVVQDHAARTMWKKEFWGKNAVTWKQFARVTCQTLGLSEPNFGNLDIDLVCLQEMLATTPKKKKIKGDTSLEDELLVKMKTFGNLIQCFGPFDAKFLRRIRKVLASKWFFGKISQMAAEESLAQHKTPGTFLIRFSRAPGFFTLSFIGKPQFEHHRIIHIPGKGCLVWGAEYDDLFAVVEAGKSKKLLRKHCSGSPYTHLFPSKGSRSKKSVQPAQSGYMLPSETDLARMYGGV